jgi:hypothetical protein
MEQLHSKTSYGASSKWSWSCKNEVFGCRLWKQHATLFNDTWAHLVSLTSPSSIYIFLSHSIHVTDRRGGRPALEGGWWPLEAGVAVRDGGSLTRVLRSDRRRDGRRGV